MSDGENARLAAAWQAGFDAALLHLMAAVNDAGHRGFAAATADLKKVPNPYRAADMEARA